MERLDRRMLLSRTACAALPALLSLRIPGCPAISSSKSDPSPHWIDYDPERNRLYVSIQSPPALTVIDTSKLSVLKRIPLEAATEFVAADSAANMVYIATPANNTVSVIDGETLAVASTLSMPRPRALAIDPGLNRLYVASDQDTSLRVVDCSTDRIVAAIALGSSANCIAIDRARHKVYTTHLNPPSVAVVDGKKNVLTTRLVLEAEAPYGLTVDSRNARLYMADHADPGNLLVLDAQSGVLLRRLKVGPYPISVTVDLPTNEIFTANFGSDTLSIHSGDTHEPIDTIQVGRSPVGIVLDPRTNTAFVACKQTGTVAVFDTRTYGLRTHIKL